jgi:hypothetical protein
MRDREIEFFRQTLSELREDARIVEWGSGGSTVMMLDLLGPKQYLTSVEHDTKWADAVVKATRGHPNRDRFDYIITGLPTIYGNMNGRAVINRDFEDHKLNMIGRFLEENPSYQSNYIDPTSLDEKFSDIFSADMFLVDGLARGSILTTIAVKAKKKNPLVMLHDYVGREEQYDWAIRLFKKKRVVETFAILTI